MKPKFPTGKQISTCNRNGIRQGQSGNQIGKKISYERNTLEESEGVSSRDMGQTTSSWEKDRAFLACVSHLRIDCLHAADLP